MSLKDDLDAITIWRGNQPAPKPYSAEHKARIEGILPEVQRDPTYAACEIVKLEGELATVLSKLEQCQEQYRIREGALMQQRDLLQSRFDAIRPYLTALTRYRDFNAPAVERQGTGK